MIVKKVRRKRVSRPSGRASCARANALARYIVDASPENTRALNEHEESRYARDLGIYAAAGERILSIAVRNLHSGSLADRLAEIDALISSASAGDDVVDHWVLSWDENDHPSIAEQEDAFRIFNRLMGLERCPSIVGFHGDTANAHGHEMVLRIDAETGLPIARPHGGWDIDAAHKAVAVIEAKYPQWKRSPERLYEVQDGRLIHRPTQADVGDPDDPQSWQARSSRTGASVPNRLLKKIDRASLDFENDTGFHSRKRVAVTEVVPILLAANGWSEAHSQLAAIGVGLALSKNNNGIVFEIDGKSVKGSIHDKTALAPLMKRWSAFVSREPDVNVARFEPRPMYPDDANRSRYYNERRAFSAAIANLTAEVRASDEGYKATLPSASYDPARISREQAPDFDQWMNGISFPTIETIFAFSPGLAGFADLPVADHTSDYPGFRSDKRGKGVAYHRDDRPYDRPAVFDAGKRIYVNDDSDASILLALRLAAARSGGKAVNPFGPPDFLARVAIIAKSESIAINPVRVKPSHGRVARAAPEPYGSVAQPTTVPPAPVQRSDPLKEPSPVSDPRRNAMRAPAPVKPAVPTVPDSNVTSKPPETPGNKTGEQKGAGVVLTPEQRRSIEAQRGQGWGR